MDASRAILEGERQEVARECCIKGAFQPQQLRQLHQAGQHVGLQGTNGIPLQRFCIIFMREALSSNLCKMKLQRMHRAGMDYKS